MTPGNRSRTAPEDTARVFFALWPDETTAEQLHRWACDLVRSCDGKAVRRETLHLTLAFLGEIPVGAIAEAEAIASTVHARKFQLQLDCIGHWRHNGILWAGCRRDPVHLKNLAESLQTRLRDSGYRLERRPFAAHVTLARRVALPQKKLLDVGVIKWHCNEIILVRSELSPAGAVYQRLAAWPLAD